jgi:hypothetical protein
VTKLQFYNDRDKVSEVDGNLTSELSALNLITSDKVPRISFCGLLIKGKKLSIFLPRSVAIKDMGASEKVLAASELMRAVEMYGQASKTAVNLPDAGEGLKGEALLGLATRLIKSYRAHGLYSHRRTTATLNSGKPDWRATVASSVAFPDRVGRPVYLDIISTKRRYFSDCEVARIQALVLRDIDERFSWIITGQEGRLAPELDEVQQPRGDTQYMLSMLRRELPMLYSDNDVMLVTSLINYLQEVSGKEDASMVIGLRKFHFAWEFMLSKVLTDVWPNINKILPAPVYQKSDGVYANAFRSGMKTDTALRRQGKGRVVIVDAKYYEATTVNNAPGWGDIVKQFFYEKALMAVDGSSDIRNVFVFPGVDGPFTEVQLCSKEDNRKFFTADFPPIYCHYVDPLKIVHYYVNSKRMPEFTTTLFGVEGVLSFQPPS